jgi:hypothetical protein
MELISKDALEAKLMLCMDMNRADWSYNKMIMANKMLEILDQEPIIEERRHGYWRIEPYLLEKTGYCSICGQNYGMPHEIYKYCPNCGAKMEGE